MILMPPMMMPLPTLHVMPPMLPTDKKLYGSCPPLSVATSRAPAPPRCRCNRPQERVRVLPCVSGSDERRYEVVEDRVAAAVPTEPYWCAFGSGIFKQLLHANPRQRGGDWSTNLGILSWRARTTTCMTLHASGPGEAATRRQTNREPDLEFQCSREE